MSLSKDDIRHLQWIYDRLQHVHKTHANTDFMLRLKRIIKKLEDDHELD